MPSAVVLSFVGQDGIATPSTACAGSNIVIAPIHCLEEFADAASHLKLRGLMNRKFLALPSSSIPALLFLTSRILEKEPYRSDRFAVGFGLAARNRLG